MTMLAVGRGLRDLANKGMSAVARAEAQENQQRLALETAEQAQDNATLGTGAGIGGMVGANRMMDASKATSDAISTFNSAIGEGAGQASTNMFGQVEFTNAAGQVTQGAEALSTMGEVAQSVDSVVQGTEVLTAGTEALQTAETIGQATEALNTVTTAAGSSGPMASLATMAGPIAIGLGVAFLLNKLFD